MNSIKTVLLGVAATATFLAPVADSRAWVAAGAGWGGHGAVAVGGYHGGYYHGGGCWGCGAAVGAVAGMAVGARDRDCRAPCTGGGRTAAVLPATHPLLPPRQFGARDPGCGPASGFEPHGGQRSAVLPIGCDLVHALLRIEWRCTTSRAGAISRRRPMRRTPCWASNSTSGTTRS